MLNRPRRTHPARESWLPALLGLSLLAACQDAKVTGAGRSGGSGSGSGGAGLGGGTDFDAASFDVRLPEGDGIVAPDVAGPGETCAEDSQTALQVPLDLLLVVDASSSMASAGVGGGSKYNLVRTALLQFIREPASAGLGLGLQFFPQPGSGSTCTSNADCGFPVLAPTPPPCQPVNACADALAAGRLAPCDGTCPNGDSCVPLGRCPVSLADCLNIGQPCPGGAAGDTCTGLGKACTTTDNQLCDPASYEALAVPIAALPMPGERLIARGLAQRGPGGATPMRPAVEGALNHLRKHLQNHPGRRGVVVIASDGGPAGCLPGNTVAATAGLLQAARAGAPAISSYVIGVYSAGEAGAQLALEQLATAGGTGTPFVIAPTENLAQKFLEALATIRGQALPCEFTIPPPRVGTIDYGRVNVRYQGAGGNEEVLYAGSAARCDAARGGWYYDTDPAAAGPRPTRIIACEATCKKFKGDAKATVDIRYGCRTRVID